MTHLVDHATCAHIMEATRRSTIVLLEIQVRPEAVDEMKTFLKKILPDTRA